MSKFDNVIGYENVKMELMLFCDVLKSPDKYKRLGVKTPSGILIYGDPGVGKTLMCKSFIEESGCKSITLRKEKPNGAFVNAIKATYERAKKEDISIVFLDDMDKFANEDEFHPDAEEYVTIQSCIDEYKEYGVFTLATANSIRDIPGSLLRSGRFDKLLHIREPIGKDALEIIKFFLSTKTTMGNIDPEEIAGIMQGYSCADLESVINEAGIYAGFDNREKIDQEDIIRACRRVLFEAPEYMDSEINMDYIMSIAYHEAGHVLVSEALMPGNVSLVSINGNFGLEEGITKYRDNEDNDKTFGFKEYEIMRTLGGKAATEVVCGNADQGCNSDMDTAFQIISYMVDGACSYGFETYERSNSSGYTLEKKDRLMSSELDRLYTATKKIIIENRSYLDALAGALADNRTLTYKDIRKIMVGKS